MKITIPADQIRAMKYIKGTYVENEQKSCIDVTPSPAEFTSINICRKAPLEGKTYLKIPPFIPCYVAAEKRAGILTPTNNHGLESCSNIFFPIAL